MNKKEILEKKIESLYPQHAIRDCFKALEKNKEADSFTMECGSMYSKPQDEEFQV